MVAAAEAGLVVGEHWALVAYGVAIAPFATGSIHCLFGAAFGDELLLGSFKELVYQVVRLLDEHETEVGKFDVFVLCYALVDERMEVCCFAVFKTEVVCSVEVGGSLLPSSLTSYAQIVGIVFKKFCKAAFGYIDEFDHHFLGGDAIHDAFGDVLFA